MQRSLPVIKTALTHGIALWYTITFVSSIKWLYRFYFDVVDYAYIHDKKNYLENQTDYEGKKLKCIHQWHYVAHVGFVYGKLLQNSSL